MEYSVVNYFAIENQYVSYREIHRLRWPRQPKTNVMIEWIESLIDSPRYFEWSLNMIIFWIKIKIKCSIFIRNEFQLFTVSNIRLTIVFFQIEINGQSTKLYWQRKTASKPNDWWKGWWTAMNYFNEICRVIVLSIDTSSWVK